MFAVDEDEPNLPSLALLLACARLFMVGKTRVVQHFLPECPSHLPSQQYCCRTTRKEHNYFTHVAQERDDGTCIENPIHNEPRAKGRIKARPNPDEASNHCDTTTQVSVDSDLEAKTVEVVGNAGPFEVDLLSFFVVGAVTVVDCWFRCYAILFVSPNAPGRVRCSGGCQQGGPRAVRWFQFSSKKKPDRNRHDLIAIPTFLCYI